MKTFRDRSDFPVIILAGGKSLRMGGSDKAKVQIGGVRMIDRVVGRLMDQAGPILLSGSQTYDLNFQNLEDRDDGPEGPAGGFYAGWLWAASAGVKGFFTAPVDGPDVPLNLCTRLYSPQFSRIAADRDRLHPTFGWWRTKDLDHVFSTLVPNSSLSLHVLAKGCRAESVMWEDTPSPFLNINSSADLRDYKRTHQI